jgi:hypothetical protein
MAGRAGSPVTSRMFTNMIGLSVMLVGVAACQMGRVENKRSNCFLFSDLRRAESAIVFQGGLIVLEVQGVGQAGDPHCSSAWLLWNGPNMAVVQVGSDEDDVGDVVDAHELDGVAVAGQRDHQIAVDDDGASD